MRASFGIHRRGRSGISASTLAETMVAVAVTTVLAAGLLVTATVIQRNFRACENHVVAQADQLRLLDFVALDLRRALTVSATSNTVTLTIPDFYDANGEPRDPVIRDGEIDYGDPDNPVPITYYMQNNAIYRNIDGDVVELASSVSNFQIAFEDADQVVSVSISFLPEFRLWGSPDSVRASTTTYTTTLLRNTRRD